MATFVFSALVDAFNASAGIVDSLIVAPRRIGLIYNNSDACARIWPASELLVRWPASQMDGDFQVRVGGSHAVVRLHVLDGLGLVLFTIEPVCACRQFMQFANASEMSMA